MKPAGFGVEHSVERADDSLTSPEARLREGELFGGGGGGGEKRKDVAVSFGLFEGFLHSRNEGADGVDSVASWDEVFAFVIQEANDLVIPRGFAVALEDFGIFAGLVIGNEERDEVGFDRFDEEGVGEDFGPEVTTASSSGDFLKEEEDGFAALLREGQGLVVITEPFHMADFDGVVLIAVGAGGKEKGGESC